jgi:hypothetical protein
MRYFFHIIDHGEKVTDEEGSDCLDLEAAQQEAKASAADLAREAIHRGESPNAICVEIQDRDGRVLSALTVREVIDHPRTPAFDPACVQPNQSQH